MSHLVSNWALDFTINYELKTLLFFYEFTARTIFSHLFLFIIGKLREFVNKKSKFKVRSLKTWGMC